MRSDHRTVRGHARTGALSIVALLVAAGTAAPAWAGPGTAADEHVLTVATDGDDAGPGTVDAPLRTLQAAVELAEPGTVIQIREGVYAPQTNVQILVDGTDEEPITMRPFEGEHVVIDGENMPHTPAPVGGSIPRSERGALHVQADHWVFQHLEIINGPYGIFALDSNHNIYEGLTTRDNYESGLHLQGASAGNVIVGLDSYGNRDPRKNGESADGLAIKEGSGEGNTVVGARLWNNADDGFDAWEFLSPIIVAESLAWGNGYNRWDLPDYSGDGNGFKMGGGDPAPPAQHIVVDSAAWDNSADGFTDNGNTGQMLFERDTAWANEGTGFDLDVGIATVNRNLAVGNGVEASLGSSAGEGNSWDLADEWSDADLVSTDPTAITGPRVDGGLPSTDFLRPAGHADLGADFT